LRVYSIFPLWRVCVFSFPSLANAPLKIYCELSARKAQQSARGTRHFFISCAVTRRKMNFHLLFGPLSLFVHVCALSTCLGESASFFNYSVKKLFSRAPVENFSVYMVKCCLFSHAFVSLLKVWRWSLRTRVSR
jgi:hypothetical protein